MRVRPATSDDVAAIHDVFAATLALGRPLAFPLPGLDAYAELCVGWFVGPELEGAAVLVADDGSVVGYALVAGDLCGHERFQRAATMRLARRLAAASVRCRLSRQAARFWRLRVRDAQVLRRRASAKPAGVVGHVNVIPSLRAGAAGRALIAHIDRRTATLGGDRWYGEMNAVAGTRASALARYGAEVVAREPNHTLTWLVGRPVERLVTLRRLDSAVPFAFGPSTPSPASPAARPRRGVVDRA